MLGEWDWCRFFILRLGSDDTTGYENGVQALSRMMRLLHRLFLVFFCLDDAVLEKLMPLEEDCRRRNTQETEKL